MEAAYVFGGTHGFLLQTRVMARFFQSTGRVVGRKRMNSNSTAVLKLTLFSKRTAEKGRTSKTVSNI